MLQAAACRTAAASKAARPQGTQHHVRRLTVVQLHHVLHAHVVKVGGHRTCACSGRQAGSGAGKDAATRLHHGAQSLALTRLLFRHAAGRSAGVPGGQGSARQFKMRRLELLCAVFWLIACAAKAQGAARGGRVGSAAGCQAGGARWEGLLPWGSVAGRIVRLTTSCTVQHIHLASDSPARKAPRSLVQTGSWSGQGKVSLPKNTQPWEDPQ